MMRLVYHLIFIKFERWHCSYMLTLVSLNGNFGLLPLFRSLNFFNMMGSRWNYEIGYGMIFFGVNFMTWFSSSWNDDIVVFKYKSLLEKCLTIFQFLVDWRIVICLVLHQSKNLCQSVNDCCMLMLVSLTITLSFSLNKVLRLLLISLFVLFGPSLNDEIGISHVFVWVLEFGIDLGVISLGVGH